MTKSRPKRPAGFHGAWITRDDAAYEKRRSVFNSRFDAHPAVIARCTSTADVVAAIRHGRAHELPLTVRCTGFNLAGSSSGGSGLLIDLSPMRAIEIDAERRVARVQGGMRGGDLQMAAARAGLAGPTGALPGTGVGLLLGGGMGHLAARIGYASDNVLAFELVTASGDLVRASPEENPDLFWAVRGSTGNFGVVTALELQLHEIPETVLSGRLLWPLEGLDSVFDALRASWEWSDDLSVIPMFTSALFGGRGGLELWFCHCGPEDEARADVERLRKLGGGAEADVRVMSFRDCHFLYEDEYSPRRASMDEQPVEAVSDELVRALLELMREQLGDGMHAIEVMPRRGAMQRDPVFPSALRDTGEVPTWSITVCVYWDDPAEDERYQGWLSDVIAVVRSLAPTNDRKHPNVIAVPMDQDAVAAMYGDRFDRLRAIKRRWDPDNIFRGTHNVLPAEDRR